MSLGCSSQGLVRHQGCHCLPHEVFSHRAGPSRADSRQDSCPPAESTGGGNTPIRADRMLPGEVYNPSILFIHMFLTHLPFDIRAHCMPFTKKEPLVELAQHQHKVLQQAHRWQSLPRVLLLSQGVGHKGSFSSRRQGPCNFPGNAAAGRN